MIEKLNAGIDWISMSMPTTSAQLQSWLYLGYKALDRVCKEGYTLDNRKLLGYEGFSAGNCFVGTNDRGGYMQFTGEKADWAFPMLFLSDCNVSRLDVQVTAQYDAMPKNIAKGAYRDSLRANDLLPVGRKRKIWIIVGSDGGDTTYIGSASSEQRGRIYNKQVQSENPEYIRCWRYEVVFKNSLALGYARDCSLSSIAPAEYARATVADWYASRGVVLGFNGGMDGRTLPLERSLPTDVERKLRWLNEQVAPTVRYLCELGFRDTILASLFPPLES